MDRLLLDYYIYNSFYFSSENSNPIILCLNAFKEADAFEDLSWLFHKEGQIYDETPKP